MKEGTRDPINCICAIAVFCLKGAEGWVIRRNQVFSTLFSELSAHERYFIDKLGIAPCFSTKQG